MLIFLRVALPSRILVVMSVEALFPFVPCGHDRVYHVDRADECDVTHSGFFLNSSLAPVLRFRRSFVSVCNVLKGMKLYGFSEARLLRYGVVGVRLFVWDPLIPSPRLIL